MAGRMGMLNSLATGLGSIALGSALIAGNLALPWLPEIASVISGWLITAVGALALLEMVGLKVLK